MSKSRLEAFSDGVIAIIITIMVLELVPPHEPTLHALAERTPLGLAYVLSFVIVGIYWNNHHHLFQIVKHVSGAVLWANLHLLFWLSLIPFATAWMGETHFAQVPVALYGVMLTMAALAYYFLTLSLLACHPHDAPLAVAVGKDVKGKLSLVICLLSLVVVVWSPIAACAFYVLIAVMWLVPDRRMEKELRRG